MRSIVRLVLEELAGGKAALVALPPLLTMPEVQKLLRTSRSVMRRQLADGTFRPKPFLRGPYRWRRVDVDLYLRETAKRARYARWPPPPLAWQAPPLLLDVHFAARTPEPSTAAR